jgi:hypothetical protein
LRILRENWLCRAGADEFGDRKDKETSIRVVVVVFAATDPVPS